MRARCAMAYLGRPVAGRMARAAIALTSLALLLAALPTALALGGADLSKAAIPTGCIGPKLTGDQPLIARPYPGGGYEVFAGVDAGAVTAPIAGVDGLEAGAGGDYTGAGAYAGGPDCDIMQDLAAPTA